MGTGSTTLRPRAFREKLRAEIDRRDVPTGTFGVRTVARLIHEQQKSRGQEARPVESLRRQLKTYLQENAPATPRSPFRHEVEDALGLERDSLCDDEEGDRAMRMTIPVVVEVPLEALEKHLNYDLIARAVEARRGEQQELQS